MVNIPDMLANVLTANRWEYENEPYYIPANTFRKTLFADSTVYRLVVDSADPEKRIGDTTYTLLVETGEEVLEIISTDSVEELIREINKI